MRGIGAGQRNRTPFGDRHAPHLNIFRTPSSIHPLAHLSVADTQAGAGAAAASDDLGVGSSIADRDRLAPDTDPALGLPRVGWLEPLATRHSNTNLLSCVEDRTRWIQPDRYRPHKRPRSALSLLE